MKASNNSKIFYVVNTFLIFVWIDRVINFLRRLVFDTILENQRLVVVNTLKNCHWFLRQPVIFKANLENQKAHLENQKAYSVNCTGKFVFVFQDNLCSSWKQK